MQQTSGERPSEKKAKNCWSERAVGWNDWSALWFSIPIRSPPLLLDMPERNQPQRCVTHPISSSTYEIKGGLPSRRDPRFSGRM